VSDIHDNLKAEFGDRIKNISDKQEGMVNKQEVDSMFNELKHMISDKDSKKDSTHAQEFIDHMTTCTDKGCSINMMKDDMEKQGFMKGLLLGKKLGNE
jgi:Rieske Fe-S protein